jgi:hypothetical protein
MGEDAAKEPVVEEASGKAESKTEAKKEFVPGVGFTTAGELRPRSRGAMCRRVAISRGVRLHVLGIQPCAAGAKGSSIGYHRCKLARRSHGPLCCVGHPGATLSGGRANTTKRPEAAALLLSPCAPTFPDRGRGAPAGMGPQRAGGEDDAEVAHLPQDGASSPSGRVLGPTSSRRWPLVSPCPMLRTAGPAEFCSAQPTAAAIHASTGRT